MDYQVTIRLAENAGPVLAFADVVLNQQFCICGFKILQGTNGSYVGMPQRKRGEAFKDVFFPINSEARQRLIHEVMSAYEAARREATGEAPIE